MRISARLPWILPFALSLALFGLFYSSTPRVKADGGAPNLAYISGTAGAISIIDIAQRRLIGTVSVPGHPEMILLSADGRLLYVTQPDLNRVIVLNTSTKQEQCSAPVSGQPAFLAIDPWTNTLYVAGSASNVITAFNPTNCVARFRVQVQGSVTGLAIAVLGNNITGGDENQLWVASASGISIFHRNGKPLTTVSLTSSPRFLCIPAGSTAYVSMQQGSLVAIDLSTFHVSSPLLTGSTFGSMDYDAITGNIYVPDLKHNQIDVLGPVAVNSTAVPREPLYKLSFPATPRSVAITNDGQFGFIALEDGSVAMLDIPGHQLITTIHVGGHPHFIITGLYPLLLSLTPRQASLLNILVNALHYTAAAVIALTAIIAILIQKYRVRRRTGMVFMPGTQSGEKVPVRKEIADDS